MTKNEYLAKSKPNIVVLIDGVPVTANLKVFSTQSVGFNASGKITLPFADGSPGVKHQLSLNLTAVGSKEWEQEAAA